MAKKRRHRRGRRKKNWFLRLSLGKKIAVCAVGVLFCLVATGAIYAAAKLSKIETEEIPIEDIVVNQEAEETGEGYTNIALFGVDSRSGGMDKGTRSDCLIVASLNNKTKEVRMISVYRDTILDIQNNYLQKCNAAYSFGGPAQAINMVNKNLDLDITEYATVNFSAIATVIDLLGGVEIDVKEEEVKYLNKFVKNTAYHAKKKAKTISGPGPQLLNGVQATTYARIRSTAGGDFTRTERQRIVIEKIVEKAKTTDLATINKIINEVFPTIKTSFSITEILSYAKDFMKYEIAESEGFPFDKTTATISGLGSIVIPVTLADNVSQLHEFLYGTEDYTPSSTVNSISGAIVARVGQRQATDDKTLNNQKYEVTEEDKAQENNQYAPPPADSNTGNNSGNTSGGNTSGGNTSGGNTSGGNTGGNTGGNSGGNSGGSDSGGGSTPAPAPTPPAPAPEPTPPAPDSGGGSESTPEGAATE